MWWLETPVLLKKAPIGPRSLHHSSTLLCPHAAIKRRPSSPLPQPGSISMYIHCLQILWLPIGGLFRNTQLWTNQRLGKACLIHILPTLFWRFHLIVRQQMAAKGKKKMYMTSLNFTKTDWSFYDNGIPDIKHYRILWISCRNPQTRNLISFAHLNVNQG